METDESGREWRERRMMHKRQERHTRRKGATGCVCVVHRLHQTLLFLWLNMDTLCSRLFLRGKRGRSLVTSHHRKDTRSPVRGRRWCTCTARTIHITCGFEAVVSGSSSAFPFEKRDLRLSLLSFPSSRPPVLPLILCPYVYVWLVTQV